MSKRIAIFILVLIAFMAIIAPLLSSHSYDKATLHLRNIPPSRAFLFGTDDLGRDLFSRVCLGARISLFVGLSAAMIDLAIGVIWGTIAAYSGGKVEVLMMRIADLLLSMPKLLVAMTLTLILGTGIVPIIVAIACIGWVPMARIVRGEIKRIQEEDFIQSAIASGANCYRIMTRHLIPNVMGPILITLALSVPKAIYAEVFLSFLGLGVQAPQASLGTLAFEAIGAMEYYPWRLLFPAAVMSLMILSLNIIADQIGKEVKKYAPA